MEGMKTLKLPVFEPPQVVNTTYLYYLGDECTDITGGWSGRAWVVASGYSYIGVEPTVTKNSDNIYFYQPQSGQRSSALEPANDIDLTDYVQHVSIYSAFGNRNGNNFASVITSRSASYYLDSAVFVKNTNNFSSIPKALRIEDITNITGLYDIIFGTWFNACGGNIYMLALCESDDISGLSTYGADIASIIANATTLLADAAAVNYMITQCTGDFMWSALADSGFITALNASPHKNTIVANTEWGKALQLIL